MRIHGRVDRTQERIVAALRQYPDVRVHSLADVGQGCPDLLVGLRGYTYLVEVKNGTHPPSKQRLTEDQLEWWANWTGGDVAILTSEEEAHTWVREARVFQMTTNQPFQQRARPR